MSVMTAAGRRSSNALYDIGQGLPLQALSLVAVSVEGVNSMHSFACVTHL